MKVKVLFIYGDTLRRGGIEYYMMNYFRHIDRNKIQIDFALQSQGQGVFDKEILNSGSNIFYLSKVGQHPFEFRNQLKKVFMSGEYNIIHTHCDAMNYRILKLAKKCGIPVRISHSHNTKHILNSRLKYHFYEFCRKRLWKYATERWACSHAAGKWLYGEHAFTVIPNAIDTEKFKFDSVKRAYYREMLKIAETDFVIGHVGRFDMQKNHSFLVEIFKCIHDVNPRYKLLLIGDGCLKSEIEKKVRQYHLDDSVVFTGAVDNPEDYYSMMDLFVLPSFFEGYPLVIKEAEANGLKCLVSDLIPHEVGTIGNVKFCKLKSDIWCEAIKNETGVRNLVTPLEVKKDGFDIFDAAKKMEERYIQLYYSAIEKR